MKYSTIITKTICLSVPFFALSCEDPQEEFSYIPPEVIYSQPGNVEDYNTPGRQCRQIMTMMMWNCNCLFPVLLKPILTAPSSINR